MNFKKEIAKSVIRNNITVFGHHINVVAGGASPRFAYTIGLSESCPFELIIAGALFYSNEEIKKIIDSIASELRSEKSARSAEFRVDQLGAFSVREVDSSWANMMMLGVLDYYGINSMAALQIVPDKKHLTIDVPDLSKRWDDSVEPIWQWLSSRWTYLVPEDSVAITNIEALKGQRVTEATRWENDQWELFAGAGPDIQEESIREVPLGTLLIFDSTLLPVLNLDIGKGFWRDPTDLEWHSWGSQT